MSTINVDIEKVKESGQDIKDLAFDFIELINEFYNRINMIPTKSNEWIGNSSKEFVNLCMLEKSNYIKYGNAIKELGICLINFSEELENRKKDSEDENYD